MIARRGEALAVTAVFGALAIVMTWPLARQIATHAPQHHDVYFNMWRLRWFAHALASSPAHLFDGNIFHPEPNTLALSDAMLVEGAIASPMIWARGNAVAVQNIMILLPIALSGTAMFALARYLTGSRAAALIAGIVFAFAPYRFEHLMHMELQWALWTPIAFLALHRLYDTGGLKYGVAAGVCVALQTLSCIYYGVFLATLLPVAALLLVRDRAIAWRALAGPAAAGAAIALVVAAVYARPFLREQRRIGDRPIDEIQSFSAQPQDYLVAPPGNHIYGNPQRPGLPERRLFPGVTAVLLACAGLLLRTPSRRQAVYLLLFAAAFEISLGFNGYSYPFLAGHLSPYRGLRALARLGIFVVLFLAVLAAYGYAAIVRGRQASHRAAIAGVLVVMLLIEYRTTLLLNTFPSTPPAVYQMLARQPRGVVAELPVPPVDRLPGREAEYAYLSTFAWFPIVNGYSGNYPSSYLSRIAQLRDFPGPLSLAQLRKDEVRYVIVHHDGDGQADPQRTREALGASGFAEVGRFDDGDAGATLYARR